MASRAFGPPKCRERVIVAPPMSKLSVSVRTCSRDKHLPALPTTTVLGNKSSAAQRFKSYPGENSVEHADWISERRAFREALDRLGDLDKWFYSKPDLTEIEILVMDREKQMQKMLPLPAALTDMAKVPQPLNRVTSLQMQARRESQEADVKSHARARDEPATELSKLTESQETGGSASRSCSDDTVLEEQEEHDQIQQQCRRDDMQREESLANSETVQMGSKTQNAHSYPSSLGGPTRDIMDGFRRQCLKEYLDCLEQNQRQGLAISQATLQRALLYPGDVSVCKELAVQQTGSGELPRFRGRRRGWMSYCSPLRIGKEVENITQGASAPRNGYKETTKRQPLTQCADTCAFWPGHNGHVWVCQPVMTQRPEGVLFHRVEHSPCPSSGHWPVNQAGYSTSGDITGRRVYTL